MALICLCWAPVASAGQGDLIVSVNPSSASSALKQADVSLEKRLAPGQLLVDPDGSSSEARRELSKNPSVASVEPDRRIRLTSAPNDPYWTNLWGIQRIGADSLWPAGSVVVAVIDSGVDYTHPDLSAQMWKNPGEIAGNGKDDDSNGLVDDVYGGDWSQGDGDPMDLNSHGTHVAGTIAASAGNSQGVAGVAPQAKIMALRFIDASGSGYTSAAILAVDYASSKGAKVINNSWGGGGYSSALSAAFDRARAAGVLVVNAAGNSSQNIDVNPSYPAAYTQDNMISVAATDSSEGLASFSNYGSSSVDLGAPGVAIQSTIPGNKYAYYSGTSMASPHVAGAAALLWGKYPDASLQQIRSAIISGGSPQSSLSGKTASGRRLSVTGASQLLAPAPTPPPSNPTPAPAVVAAPSITRSGQVLRCNPGSWKGATSYAYAWKRDDVVIPGASGQSYTLTEADNLRPMRCTVTASGPGGSTSTSSSAVVVRVPLSPKVLIAPSVVGSLKPGRVAVCVRGVWTGESPMRYSFKWLVNGSVVSGASSSAYVVKGADSGASVTCRVEARNSVGAAEAESQAVAVSRSTSR